MYQRLAIAMMIPFLTAAAGTPVLHVSIVSHNEESGGRNLDYLNNQRIYLQNREYVRQLALMIKSKGAKYNLQSDWTFLQAVARYDTAAVTATTNGKNILKWLVEDLGYEADPHAHESRYNYADVAYLHQQLGLTPSKVVGGFLFSPAANPQGWEQHSPGIFGHVHGSYFWRADILWGAATSLHQGADDETYGIWRPKDKEHFQEHSDLQRLVYIGGGCKTNLNEGTTGGLDAYLGALAKGRLNEAKLYTATIMINQGRLNPSVINNLASELDRLEPYVAAGQVGYRGLSELVRQWSSSYGARPSQTSCEEMEALSR